MTIDYAQAFKKAITFCIEPKRWIPFLVLDLAIFSVALTVILSNMSYLLYFLYTSDINLAFIGPALSLFLVLFSMLIVWALVNLWISGALIHQSYKEKEFGKSWGIAGRKYLSLFAVFVVTGIISLIVSIIPYVGWLIAIFTGLVFFFSLQGVIVRGSGFIKSIEDSWHILKRYPFKVFLMWLLVTAMALLIILIFSIPLIAFVISMVFEVTGSGAITTTSLMSVLLAIQDKITMLVVTGVIFLVGLAISRTFAIKAQTEFYLQIKKK